MPSFTDSRLGESSGLSRSLSVPWMLWTLNDENTKPQVFGVDSTTGKTVATFSFKKADITDPEAICVDPQGRLWYADIGDNVPSSRAKVQLLVTGEPGVGNHGALTFTRYRLDYPGGARNAESFLINPVSNAKYVISKEATSKLYALPDVLKASGTNRLTLVASTFGANVSDAAFTPDGRFVLYRRESQNTTVYVQETSGWTLAGTITVPSQVKPEGITVAADQLSFWISSEGQYAPFFNVTMPGAYQPASPTSPAPPPPHASPPSHKPPPPPSPCG